MSLEATHIRFAVELKDKYRASNLSRYIPGAIYPDSRYFTGIDRQLTHPADYPNWDLAGDDFRKGWHVHLLCDKLCAEIAKEFLPQVFEGSTGLGSEVWIKHTAIKALQDLDDLKKFDSDKYFPYLNNAENPNGENVEEIKKYHRVFLEMYADLNEADIDSHYYMWERLGIGTDLATKLKLQAEIFSKDESVMKAIPMLYPAMLSRAEKALITFTFT